MSDPWKEISDGKSYGIKFGKKAKGEEERASDPFEDGGGGYGYVYDDVLYVIMYVYVYMYMYVYLLYVC